MKNLEIYLSLVNNGRLPLNYNSGKDLIRDWISADIVPDPVGLCIKVKTNEGRSVTLVIPYSNSGEVFVEIDESIEN